MKIKSISKTVDAYPNTSPIERYRMMIEERTNYPKEVLDAIFKNLQSSKLVKNEKDMV